MLDSIPESVWPKGPFDVGECKDMAPISVSIKEDKVIYRKQYSWP